MNETRHGQLILPLRFSSVVALLWVALVIGLLIWFTRKASADQGVRKVQRIHFTPSVLHSPKGHEQAIPIVREGLISDPPPMFGAVIPVPGPKWFFAATAKDSAGLESVYSNEAVYDVPKGSSQPIMLDWDAGQNTNTAITYSVYRGKRAGMYTEVFKAGTNLSLTISIPPLTNLVISVTTSNATNLSYASALNGTWKLLGSTNWSATNASGTRFWRAVGSKSSRPSVRINYSFK